MAIKEYDVDVILTKKVKVKIDDQTYGENFLEEFSSYMWEVDSIEDIVEHIARCTALEFDPEGVGVLKKWNETEESMLEDRGFTSQIIWQDEEVEINDYE